MKIATNNDNQSNQVFSNYLVVKFHDDFKKHSDTADRISTFKNYDLQCEKISRLFSNVSIKRLFSSLSPEKITALITKACVSDSSYQPTDLFSYYRITAPGEINLHHLQKALLKLEYVELAYIQGRTNNPSTDSQTEIIASLQQGYLSAAPWGVNAKYAWEIKGGRGEGNVKFIDIEQGWNLVNGSIDIQTLPLTGINEGTFGYHGSSVLSIISMKENSEGYSGITTEANSYVISQWRPDGLHNDADAILSAISYLNYGDILLLEAQSFYSGNENSLWPVEIHDASFEVIRLATALGIIVIEAGGNGNQSDAGNDLDLFELNGKRVLNPASSDFKDSGSIIVAAAT
ncbi:MAG: peptidase S8, partial [Bacteroidota bacterium]